MSTPEPDARRLPAPERMVAFTDAAVAIALTLLVLPLTDLVPEAVAAGERATEVVTGNLAVIGSFLLSFVVIARYWVVHHRLFGFGRRLTAPLVWLNLFWVLTIAILPFLTELVALYGQDAFVVRTYVGVLLLTSLTLTAMTLLMRRIGLADADGSGPPEAFVVGSISASVNIALALVVVLVAPQVGYFALLLLTIDRLTEAVVRRLRQR